MNARFPTGDLAFFCFYLKFPRISADIYIVSP